MGILLDFNKALNELKYTEGVSKSFWNVVTLQEVFSSVQFSRSVMSDSLRPHES